MAGELLARIAARLAASGQLTSPGPAGELVILGPGGSWSVFVVEHHRGEDHAAVLLSRICDENTALARTMLVLAAQMGAGAIALVGGSYVVRFTIPAALIDSAPLERSIAYVRDLARELAAEIEAGVTAPDPSAFRHHAD